MMSLADAINFARESLNRVESETALVYAANSDLRETNAALRREVEQLKLQLAAQDMLVVRTSDELMAHAGETGRKLGLVNANYDFNRRIDLRASLIALEPGACLRWPSDFKGTCVAIGANGVTIEGVAWDTIDGKLASRDSRAIQPLAGVGKLTILRNELRHVGSFLSLEFFDSDGTVADCTSPNGDGLSGYFVFLGGSRFEVRRNVIANSVNETIVRGHGREHVIAGNTLTNVKAPDPSTLPWDTKEGTVAMQDCIDCWVIDNVLNGDAHQGPLPIPPRDNGKPHERCVRLRFLRNRVRGLLGFREGTIDATVEGNTARRLDIGGTDAIGRNVTFASLKHDGEIRRW